MEEYTKKQKENVGNFLNIGGNNECYTPKEVVKVIQKYIPKNKIIWCPFDKSESEFVIELSKTNKVIYSHIDDGKDFYSYEPKEYYDIIVSNPPFENKKKIFERAIELNKPFALIMMNTWLNDSTPKKLFKDINFQLLMLVERIKFIKPNGEEMGRPPFSCSFYCRDLLPKDIIIEDHRE